jgi:Tfp pilus assembly protein PilV
MLPLPQSPPPIRAAWVAGRALPRAGFSLVEVIISLGILAFAIIPLIGLMGGGLKISQDSIQSSNLAEIYRQGEVAVSSDPTATSLTPMFFTSSVGPSTAGSADAIYRLSFTSTTPGDAAQGLLARKLWKLTVARADATSVILGERFVFQSQEPSDAFFSIR